MFWTPQKAAIISSNSAALSGVGLAHRYWRLSVTAVQGGTTDGFMALSELYLAETKGAQSIDVSGATVTASSQQVGYEASKLFDGILTATNPWATNGSQSFPRTLTIDFGSSSSNWKSIQEIRMTAAVNAGYGNWAPKDFTWAWSDDNSNWTTVITQTGITSWSTNVTSSEALFSKNFQTAACVDTAPGYLYFRLNITAGNDSVQCAIGELEVRETQGGADMTGVYTECPITFNSETANRARDAFNNNTGSNGWFATSGFPYRIGCQFAYRRNIAQVAIMPYPAFQAYAPKDFKIQGSNDNSTWTDLLTVTNSTGWSDAPTFRLFNI